MSKAFIRFDLQKRHIDGLKKEFDSTPKTDLTQELIDQKKEEIFQLNQQLHEVKLKATLTSKTTKQEMVQREREREREREIYDLFLALYSASADNEWRQENQ